ncbi:TatD family hydrolase [Clostridium aestuarii]|uniref:TatD family hydrolase n=1 Tax=Clostridium aestuarii TaxID=338193 RepID=A0ABT4D364_9CLOT|nr:TatD family hydrolase [Clostridium aestuarii]MCY6485679.1 TatD family hydrolase [Clostridium aestuarii]
MFVDSHTHLDHYQCNEIERAINQINKEKIITINNSMDVPSYIKNLKISKNSKYIIPTFGIHPWNAPKYVDKLQEIKKFIDKTSIIGEIGLDFCWVQDKNEYEAQRKILRFFLEKAKQQNKIINLHTKGAEKEILELLNKYEIEKAIIHWYSGSIDILNSMIERNFYFTIGVEVTYSDKIKKIAEKIPLDRLLTETDGPGAEEWLTHKRGMPILIKNVIKDLADIKKIPLESMNNIVIENFKRIIPKNILNGL